MFARNFFGDYRVRIGLLLALGLIGFAVLAAKLYFEQIRRGAEHSRIISRQSIRRIRIPARRGKIFSSDLKVLADNASGCAINFYPAEMRRPGKRANTIDYIHRAAAAVARALGRPNPLTPEEITRHLNVRPGLPITVFEGLSPSEAAPVLEEARNFSGIGLETADARSYPEGSLAFHLIGYARQDDPRRAEDRDDFFYYVPDLVGRDGLEKKFDSWPYHEPKTRPMGLRGIAGLSVVQVDHQGFIHDAAIASREPVDGNHLVLTLDSRAQAIGESLLRGRRGAMVLLDAGNGDVLAMASSPSPDLREFSPALSSEYYRGLLKNPMLPLINRTTGGLYTPGSILKPLVALALLERGVDPTVKVNCTGKVDIGTGKISCAAIWGHGELDMWGAIEKSCNCYFIVNGIAAGRAPIADVLARAGIARPTGFVLGGSIGTAPTEENQWRRYRTRWNNFDTGLLSIGQGIVRLTPLQAALYTGALANGGQLYKPQLARELVDHRGGVLWQREAEPAGRLTDSAEHLKIIREGMFRVVHSPEGSGRRANTPAIELYGKTGSAEVGSGANRHKNTWFIAFGTHRERTYAIVFLIEEGGSGGGDCAPLAGEFFRRYLDGITPRGGES